MTIDVRVYDPFLNFLGLIPERIDPTFNETHNDAGAGSFKVHPYAASLVRTPGLLNYGNIVMMKTGSFTSAWIIDKVLKTVVGEGEEAVTLWEVTGSGALNLLREMVLYPEYGLPALNSDVLEVGSKDKDSTTLHPGKSYGFGQRFKTRDTMTVTHLGVKVVEAPESVNAPKRVQIYSGDRLTLIAQSNVFSSPLVREDGSLVQVKFAQSKVLAAETEYFASVLYVNGYRGAPLQGYAAGEEYSGNIQAPAVVESYILVGSGDNFRKSIVPIFRDSFDRTPSPTVGNGWTELGSWAIADAPTAADRAAVSATSVGALIREYGKWDTTSVIARFDAPSGGSPSLVIHTTEELGLRGGFRCFIDLDATSGNNVFIRKNNIEVFAAWSEAVAALTGAQDIHFRFKKTFRHYEVFVNRESVGFYVDNGADVTGKWSGVGQGAAKTTRFKAVELTCERAERIANPGPPAFILYGTDRYIGTTKETRQRGGTERHFSFIAGRGVSGWYKPSMWKAPVTRPYNDVTPANPHRKPEVTAKGGFTPAPVAWRDKSAFWIWDSDPGKDAPSGQVFMRKEFTTTERQVVDIFATADNSYELSIDGEPILVGENWQTVDTVQYLLEPGPHVLAALVLNTPGDEVTANPAGFLCSVHRRMPYVPDNPDTPAVDESKGHSYPHIVHTDSTWVVRNASLQPPPGFNAGEIMTQILSEALARGCNAARVLTPTWTSDLDSQSKDWGAPVERKVKVGTDYFSLLEQLVETSADIWVDASAGTLALRMAVERGTDRSLADENLVAFQVGDNVAEESYEGTGAEIRSTIVVVSEVAALEISDDEQAQPAIRREMYLELGDAASLDQISKNTSSTFAIRRKPQESITLNITPVSKFQPWRDFFVGDWVLGPGVEARKLTRYRVKAITATEDDRGLVSFTLELSTIAAEENERLARWLKSMVPGTGGGSVASARPVEYTGVRLIPPTRSTNDVEPAQPVSFSLQTVITTSDEEGFTLTLSNTPVSGSLVVTLNGIEQEAGTDFTLEDDVIVFNDPLMVEAGDRIDVRYAYA